MFNNHADYRKMEYTSNRLRKEFLAEGRRKRQSDRKNIGGHRLTPWEKLSIDEKDLCSHEAITFRMKLRRKFEGIKASKTF